MKFKHKPLVIEAEPFEKGTEDGILLNVRDRKNTRVEPVYFGHKKNEDTEDRIKASRFSAYEVSRSFAIVIGGVPVPIKEGDFIQTAPGREVLTKTYLEENYTEIKGRNNGQQDEGTEGTGGEHQTENSQEPPSGQVRQGGEPDTENEDKAGVQ